MSERFVGEPIEPVAGSFDTGMMAAGEPGLPERFLWRGREYRVAGVLEKWKSASACRSGADEQYIRKHWYRVVTQSGEEMRLYCDRQPRPGDARRRWWLFTICGGEEAQTGEKR